MCKILTVVVAFFMDACLFYFPWPRLATARLDHDIELTVALIAITGNSISI